MGDVRHVRISYDPDARVWWAESDELPGLVSEAPTQVELIDRVVEVAPELLSGGGAPTGEVTLRFIELIGQPVTQDRAEYA